MENRDKNASNEKMIEAIKERLNWYASVPAEEFDEDEVAKLVGILDTLEPPKVKTEQEQEAELERFRKYCEIRMSEEDWAEFDAMMEAEDATQVEVEGAKEKSTRENKTTDIKYSNSEDKTNIPKNNKRKGIFYFARTHKLVTAAAAAVVMLLVLSTSLGIVNAERNGGFFHWLSRDEQGVTMITGGEDLDNGVSLEDEVTYNKVEEIPEIYLKYIVDKVEITRLENYNLQNVRIGQNTSFFTIRQFFVNEENENRVTLGIRVYKNEVSLLREYHEMKESQQIENDNIVEGELYVVEEKSQPTEYAVIFYVNNMQYFVEGNSNVTLLKEIAEEYKQFILLFNNSNM